jgi:two-component system response regulator HydG
MRFAGRKKTKHRGAILSNFLQRPGDPGGFRRDRSGVDLARDHRVDAALAADRFVREPSRAWRDLATGRVVNLTVREIGSDWPARERELDASWLSSCPGREVLVDFDRIGTQYSFEARARLPDVPAPPAHERLQEAARCLMGAIDPGAVGFQIVEARMWPAMEREWLLMLLGRVLRRMGFVPVRPSHWNPSALAGSRAGRHVALLWPEDEPGEAAIEWIRHLSDRSARQHLLVRIPARPRRACAVVREGGPVFGCARDASTTPHGIARARMALARGEFEATLATLASVRAACAAGGEPLPDEWRTLDVQAHFWLGRFGTARTLASGLSSATDRAGWLGLLSWALFDWRNLELQRAACGRWAERGDPQGVFWSGVLARLPADAFQASTDLHELDREWACRCPGDLRLIADLARVEHARATGGIEPALTGAAGEGEHRSDLRGLVAQWLTRTRRDASQSLPIATPVVDRGAFGVLRCGQRREDMRILHLVPGLLQVVHDAEDERVALDAACAWVRTQACARGVAVVTGADGRLVAQAGWPERQVRAEVLSQVCRETPQRWIDTTGAGGAVQVAAPVRYAGAMIGHVLAFASPSDVQMVEDAVQACAALCGPALRARLDALTVPDDPSAVMPELIGRSPVMMAVRDQVRQAARTGFSVVIEGESGTGKELVARALHRLSDRRSRRFMAVNCAALTDDLVEAELFGFARGAFTGAVTARPGLFEDAHGGSLFLDEVSELSARAQAKLLRALQEREVRRVGENTARPVDVRVIAATNQPLAEAAAARRFREDLLFRLAVVRLAVPPLRDRLEDLPALAAAFWRRAMDDVGKHARLTREAVAALCGYGWPGNVRELQNVMAGLAVRAPARGRLGAREVRAHLSGAPAGSSAGVSLEDLRRQCERRAVAGALARHGGRRAPAARELGLSRQGL